MSKRFERFCNGEGSKERDFRNWVEREGFMRKRLLRVIEWRRVDENKFKRFSEEESPWERDLRDSLRRKVLEI